MNEQEYTVFAVNESGASAFYASSARHDKKDQSLSGLIAYVSASTDGLMTPIAWAAEGTKNYGGTKRTHALREESIAAGRLIEKTPSGWVALGAEKQEDELRKVDPSPAIQAEPAFLKDLRDLVAIQGADGNWNDDDYSCGLYNGLELALATAEGRDPQYRTLSAPAVLQAPASTAKSNPFPTTLRSPDCDSGPSDHLNASRHQMAGMKG